MSNKKPNCFDERKCERCIHQCYFYQCVPKSSKIVEVKENGILIYRQEYYDGRVEFIDEYNDLAYEKFKASKSVDEILDSINLDKYDSIDCEQNEVIEREFIEGENIFDYRIL